MTTRHGDCAQTLVTDRDPVPLREAILQRIVGLREQTKNQELDEKERADIERLLFYWVQRLCLIERAAA